MESLKDLKSDKILISIEKEIAVECCVWGHHTYQIE